jgi:hypothetical protein
MLVKLIKHDNCNASPADNLPLEWQFLAAEHQEARHNDDPASVQQLRSGEQQRRERRESQAFSPHTGCHPRGNLAGRPIDLGKEETTA